MANEQNLKPFKKGGDERINLQGRPQKLITQMKEIGYTKSQVEDTMLSMLSLSRWRWMRKVSPPNHRCIGKRTNPTTKTSRKHSQGVSFASIWNSHYRTDSVLIDRLVCQSLR